jgi:hypothetical protein
MRLTAELLTHLVEEEIKIYLKSKKNKPQKLHQEESVRERHGKYHPGYDDLAKLSKCIVEDDELQEKNKAHQGCVGNSNRNSQGEFTNATEEPYGSWINMGKNCKGRGKMKRRGRKELYTKLGCGRNEPYRCKDGSKKDYY